MLLSARRSGLFAVVVSLGALVFGGGVARAAAPEAPLVKVQSRTDSSAILSGVLSPNGLSPQEGSYEFLYAASSTTCTGESRGNRGLSFGFGGEGVSEEIGGLSPHTTYTACLLDRNLSGEETISAPATFTTSFAPEAPETGTPNPLAASTAMLRGVLNPNESRAEEPGAYEFVYRPSGFECEGEGAASTGPLAAGSGALKEAVEHQVSGLAPDTQYTVCLRAWNGTGQYATGAPVTFTTLSTKPAIGNEGVSSVGSSTATVTAHLDSGGLPTSYSVEYGPTVGYGASSAVATLPGGARTVSVTLAGLQPSSEYHFRFLASNEDGSQQAPDGVFTTYPAIAGLPDGRVYEMVTPPENHSADVYEPSSAYQATLFPGFKASAEGDAVAYVAQTTVGGNGSSGNSLGNQYIARRSAQGGWSQQNVTPEGSYLGTEYQGFTSDLSTGFISVGTAPPFVPTEEPKHAFSKAEEPGSAEVLYARLFAEPLFRPLFTTPQKRPKAGPARSGSWVSETLGYEEFERPAFAGASQDGGRVFFELNEALLEGRGKLEEELNSTVSGEIKESEEIERLREEGKSEEARELQEPQGHLRRDELYESAGGVLTLVNVLPDGSLAPGAVYGGMEHEFQQPSVNHAISADGSRVFWTLEETRAIYVRENGTKTVQVAPGPAVFWTASDDGKYAFYAEAGKLWRFDVEDESRTEIAGASGGVQGVIGANETGEDGAYVYFVSHEALPGLENANKASAVLGEDNVYVYEPDPEHPGGARIQFVATLSSGDSSDWGLGLGGRSSNLTPDGHALVFTSSRNLTGHAYGDEGDNEVYVYDARDGSLDCASCRPQASGATLWPTRSMTYVYKWLSENGDRVFFETGVPLVSNDVNGEEDVYEWERDGTGECSEASGCVYLISNGIEGPSEFIDASVSGNDAFFITRGRLVAQDGNETYDLYDARVGGVPPVSPAQCSGTGCQGVPAAAPFFATPPSVTFSGVGNFASTEGQSKAQATRKKGLTRAQKLAAALRACRGKRARRGRSQCERRARARYTTHGVRKPSHGKGK